MSHYYEANLLGLMIEVNQRDVVMNPFILFLIVKVLFLNINIKVMNLINTDEEAEFVKS